MILPDSQICLFCAGAVFLFGTILGSFLNVVILRYRTGRTLNGRSLCFSCSTTLGWSELIPLLSYIIQKGRCRTCHANISPQYFLVELSLGLMYLATYLVYGISLTTLLLGIIWFIFLLITVYDIRHKIIPDRFLMICVGVIVLFYGLAGIFELPLLGDMVTLQRIMIHVATGIGMALPFAMIWLVSKGRLMGLGDPKLMLVIGLMLGFPLGISALVLSFWIGALVSLIVIMIQKLRWNSPTKGSIMKQEIPFGPFLVLATFITTLYSLDILAFISW